MPTPLLWKKLAALYGGKVTLWVDQSDAFNDPLKDLPSVNVDDKNGLLRILGDIVTDHSPSGTEGQCMAIVYDWIRSEFQLGEDFAGTFRGANDFFYKARQLLFVMNNSHRNFLIRARAIERSILRSYKTLLRFATDKKKIEGDILEMEKTIEKSTEKIETMKWELYKPTFAPNDGVHVQDITEKAYIVSGADIGTQLDQMTGWVCIAIESQGAGGHAIGVSLATKKLLDPNAGLFTFESLKGLKDFLAEVLWDKIYDTMYGAPTIKFIKYGLYPSLKH